LFEAPTLADVAAAIKKAEHLSARTRADLLSALNTVRKVLGLPLADAPAHPLFLQRRLARVSPVAHGLSPGRWSNVRSLVRKALDVAGVTALPGRYRVSLPPAWLELQAKLPSRNLHYGLSRFFCFCAVHGIEPAAVDDEVMRRFRQALLEKSLLRNPEKAARQALTAWNHAVSQVPGWPPRQLEVPAREGLYCLPWSAFPASLSADTEAWLARLTSTDLLDDLPVRPIRPVTATHRRRQIRQLASALAARGRDPASIRTLGDLVQPQAAKEILRFFLGRQGGESNGRIQSLAYLLLAIARHWVKNLGIEDLKELQELARRCSPEQQGMTERNRVTLRACDEAAVQRLLELPRKYAAGIKRTSKLSYRGAVKLQTALLIDLLTVAPLRMKNLLGLCLDRHVVRLSDEVLLSIPVEETKNSVEITLPLPSDTVELLDLYLAVARPVLAGSPSPFLFPGRNGGHKHHVSVASQITTATHREVGVRLHPHLFRHLACKLLLEQGGELETARSLMAHKQIATTAKFYASLEQRKAAKRYDALIDGLRKKEPKAVVRKARKKPGSRST
jgi:integrase